MSERSHSTARRVAARAALALVLMQIVCLVTAATARDPAAASSPPPRGALTLLTGPGGCVGSPCTHLRGATALVRIAVSPDGRNLYLSGQAGGLSILARDGRTGRMHQLVGRSGCFRRDGRQGCALLRTLTDPVGLTVSPDGRDVYVTTTHGVLGFARNRQTGVLRPLTGGGRCVDATLPGCRPMRGLPAPTELIASGNGTLYVAGSVPHAGGAATGALVVLSRNPATGALSQHAGRAGCFDAVATPGCSNVPCLDTLPALAPARDRRHLYVGSTDSLDIEATGSGALATFASSPATGALSYIGCVTTVNAISSVVPERGGTGVLVDTMYANRGTGRAEATIDLFAPGPGGLLTRVRRAACAQARGCQIPIDFDSSVLALTPRGDTLYYAAFFSGIAALRVGSHRLSALPGRAACVVARRNFMPLAPCTRAGQVVANDIAVSPDGHNLYVGFIGNSRVRDFYGGGIEAFTIRR
jgi:DNA-binding beta-propeller fold protein YncE